MTKFASRQFPPVHQQLYSPWSPRDMPLQASALSVKENTSCDANGDVLWGPSSWESQASFDMLAGFLCLADGSPESSASDQTSSCCLLRSPGAAIDSSRSSSDSDQSSLPESFRTSSSTVPEHTVLSLQSHQQSRPEPHCAIPNGMLSLRLNHEDVMCTWNKMSGGKAAFFHQHPNSAPAKVTPEMSNAFVPLVPQGCSQHGRQPIKGSAADVANTRHAQQQFLNQTAASPSAPGLPAGLCCPQASSGPAEAAESGFGSRQARLDRYREKKRTRGFSSKVRYEMRKINAERRPRVKGRFVKREDLTESIDDMLAGYDPVDFSMITALDMSDDSYLI